MNKIRFAINRTCLPHGSLDDFLNLACDAGVEAIEIRNDIPGQEFANGIPARELRALIDEKGLKVASVNALQRFNDWNMDREKEARALIRYAAELGAPGVVLCPAHTADDDWTETRSHAMLVDSLKNLRPILRDEGVIGYVEPLGMQHSTMKQQAKAVVAIEEIDGWDSYALCYDTFQFFRCGDGKAILDRVALIHISGIARTDLAPAELTEPDRGLVLEGDRVDNIGQLRRALAAGYRGYISVEPFNGATQRDPALAENLRQSITRIRASL